MTAALMFQGTGSDVGKSVLVAGICRALTNKGYAVRPFKPQNMSNNAAVTPDGGEIGRAQALQALACRTESSVHMNPVLLKPQGGVSQVIVQGQVIGEGGMSYFRSEKGTLLNKVLESYDILKKESDFIIVEGAGSPAEVNLRKGDIANMGFATRVDIPTLLIGDINRGGVIASLVGTHNLLPSNEQKLIKGYIINKFRGDISLFDNAHDIIKGHTGWSSFGVLPFLECVGKLPAEDGVALDHGQERGSKERIRIAVPRLAHIANFDDFDPLQAEEDVYIDFIQPGSPLPLDVDLIIIPGSKATISDLLFLREQGWDIDLKAYARRGGQIVGICGGYQMLGQSISDPEGIEGYEGHYEGLGLLQITTTLSPEKTVKLSSVTDHLFRTQTSGYEIHLGVTEPVTEHLTPWQTVDNRVLGYASKTDPIRGTYLHGMFSEDEFRAKFLKEFRGNETSSVNYRQSLDNSLNELAEEIETYLDMDAMIELAKGTAL